jgi:hypothetical protein
MTDWLIGDVDGNDTLDIGDVLLLIEFLFHSGTLTPDQTTRAIIWPAPGKVEPSIDDLLSLIGVVFHGDPDWGRTGGTITGPTGTITVPPDPTPDGPPSYSEKDVQLTASAGGLLATCLIDLVGWQSGRTLLVWTSNTTISVDTVLRVFGFNSLMAEWQLVPNVKTVDNINGELVAQPQEHVTVRGTAEGSKQPYSLAGYTLFTITTTPDAPYTQLRVELTVRARPVGLITGAPKFRLVVQNFGLPADTASPFNISGLATGKHATLLMRGVHQATFTLTPAQPYGRYAVVFHPLHLPSGFGVQSSMASAMPTLSLNEEESIFNRDLYSQSVINFLEDMGVGLGPLAPNLDAVGDVVELYTPVSIDNNGRDVRELQDYTVKAITPTYRLYIHQDYVNSTYLTRLITRLNEMLPRLVATFGAITPVSGDSRLNIVVAPTLFDIDNLWGMFAPRDLIADDPESNHGIYAYYRPSLYKLEDSIDVPFLARGTAHEFAHALQFVNVTLARAISYLGLPPGTLLPGDKDALPAPTWPTISEGLALLAELESGYAYYLLPPTTAEVTAAARAGKTLALYSKLGVAVNAMFDRPALATLMVGPAQQPGLATQALLGLFFQWLSERVVLPATRTTFIQSLLPLNDIEELEMLLATTHGRSIMWLFRDFELTCLNCPVNGVYPFASAYTFAAPVSWTVGGDTLTRGAWLYSTTPVITLIPAPLRTAGPRTIDLTQQNLADVLRPLTPLLFSWLITNTNQVSFTVAEPSLATFMRLA